MQFFVYFALVVFFPLLLILAIAESSGGIPFLGAERNGLAKDTRVPIRYKSSRYTGTCARRDT